MGEEIRACWQEADRPAATTALLPRDSEPAPKLDFVPVGEVAAPVAPAPATLPAVAVSPVPTALEPRAGLWDD
jgi:hypothetical protein